jgi:hypothetical protein
MQHLTLLRLNSSLRLTEAELFEEEEGDKEYESEERTYFDCIYIHSSLSLNFSSGGHYRPGL